MAHRSGRWRNRSRGWSPVSQSSSAAVAPAGAQEEDYYIREARLNPIDNRTGRKFWFDLITQVIFIYTVIYIYKRP